MQCGVKNLRYFSEVSLDAIQIDSRGLLGIPASAAGLSSPSLLRGSSTMEQQQPPPPVCLLQPPSPQPQQLPTAASTAASSGPAGRVGGCLRPPGGGDSPKQQPADDPAAAPFPDEPPSCRTGSDDGGRHQLTPHLAHPNQGADTGAHSHFRVTVVVRIKLRI